MKIVILPMDNRPPNYQFVRDFAQIYNLNISIPEACHLGGYKTPGDIDFLMEWLYDQTGDVFIISVEMLCYGGLVFSRDQSTTLSQAMKRFSLIKKIKDKNPNSKIFLSSIVRRALITVDSSLTKRQYDLMNEYLHAIEEKPQKASELEKKLPENFVNDYRKLRKRNHLINITCLDYVKDNIAELVVFAQEDTFPNGPQKSELEILDKMRIDYAIYERVFIHNGADEVVQELLIKTFNNSAIDIVYDSDNTKKKIMDYEDRFFEENVKSHMRLTGFTESKASNKALLICGTDIESGKKQLERLLNEKKEVHILDIFLPNGSNPDFVKEISENIKNLKCYSSWNTASNSLGTILATMAISEKKDETQLFRFFLNRLIDDHLYQGVYRKKLETTIEKNGEQIYNIKKDSKILEEFSNFFAKEAELFIAKTFKRKNICIKNKSRKLNSISLLSFYLPWNRTFECQFDTKPDFSENT